MINKIILTGRLTADPELKKTTSNLSVTSFTLAVDRNYQSGGEKKADFINCVAWRQTAEFITRYFTKGSLIALVGELQQKNYQTQSGEKRTTFEVNVNEVSFCESRKAAPAESERTDILGNTDDAAGYEDYDTDTALPF